MICDVDVGRPDATRTHTLEVARWLAVHGWDVELVARGDDPHVEGVGFRSAGAGELARASRVAAVNATAAVALKEARGEGAAAYVRHYWGVVPTLVTARVLGYGVVTQVDDMRYGPGYEAREAGPRGAVSDYTRRAAAHVMARTAHAVVAVTDGLKTLLVRDYGVSAERVHVLPNGVDVDEIVPLERRSAIRRAGLDASLRYALFMGNFAEWVDFDTMLRGFADTSEARDDVRLLLVGDGPQRRAVERLVTGLGIEDRVTLTGFVRERARIRDLLGAASVCIAAHRTSHLGRIGASPTKIAEYFAAGRPVVAIDLPGVTEMIERNDAGVVTPAVPAAFARALGELFDDPARADELGANARVAAEERYSWRAIVGEIAGLLRAAARAA